MQEQNRESAEFKRVVQLFQQCLQEVPVIVIGSGASAQYGIGGMWDLGNHLAANVIPESNEVSSWEGFRKNLVAFRDLEKALQESAIPGELFVKIVHCTRNMILDADRRVFTDVVRGSTQLFLVRLFRCLFRSSNRELSVVTTNYDRLVEYAADIAGYGYRNGFSHGYVRSFVPNSTQATSHPGQRTVCVWKVHGSLDWFRDENDLAVSLPDDEGSTNSLEPLLVTPGITKYEQTHKEPFRTIIRNSDTALENANSYLSIGYGFNDDHIQPKLIEGASRRSLPAVVLARTLTTKAKEFISSCNGMNYLALEKSDSGTKAYYPEHPSGIEIPDCELWNPDKLLDVAIS